MVKMPFSFWSWLAATILALAACTSTDDFHEIQLTHDLSYNHDLDNNDNFSPDDQWLVYDTRTDEGGIGGCTRIEKVNVQSGETKVLYELKNNHLYGPGVGAPSYSPVENKVVFIHGLMNCTADNPYEFWRRTGVIVEEANPGVPVFMDSRDIYRPFTVGALRGGTHRHEWSGDGQWIGFTYNDAIMQHLEDSTGEVHNLRTIGVSKHIPSPKIALRQQGENVQGSWFSVLVVEVVAHPTPGSDEISHAAGDRWIGNSGYQKPDGSLQRARGFVGTVKTKAGKDVDEIFVVDIPEDITIADNSRPLQGTLTDMPAPPQGTHQRRLTYTSRSEHPGCTGDVRSSSDGKNMAFLAYDANGMQQIFTISPLGGKAIQQTFHDTDVQSGVRWHPDGKSFCYVWNNRIILRALNDKKFISLTQLTDLPPSSLVWSHDGHIIAYNRQVADKEGKLTQQIFFVQL